MLLTSFCLLNLKLATDASGKKWFQLKALHFDAAGSAPAQPGHIIGKSAARPIVIAWLVASGEFSCCLAVAVATRPPIGDVCILSACDAGQLLLTIFLLGDDYCPIGNSPRLPRAMLFASVPSVRCARLHGPPVGGYGQW